MPEIKRSFTQGRMNKDLDERIIPNGEYRDALNIEVTTSEGSNIGAVQSLRGNSEVSNKVDDNATCVGVLPDEENNVIYYWVHDAKTQEYVSGVHSVSHTSNGINTDALLRYNLPTTPNSYGSVDVILSDLHFVKTRGDYFNAPSADQSQSVIPIIDLTGICVGMEVMAYNSNGTFFWNTPNNPIVTAIDTVNNTVTLNDSVPAVLTIDILNGVYYEFTHEKALNLTVGTFMNVTTDGGSTYTNYSTRNVSKKIHSSNIIDELLFFTDDNDEPKKVNVRRSFDGSVNAQDLLSRTRLYVEGFSSAGALVQGSNSYFDKGPIKKEHITVIRPNPVTPLTVELKESARDGIVSGTFSAASTMPTPFEIGGTFTAVDNATLDLEVGDVLRLTINGSATPNNEVLLVTVISVDNTTVAGQTQLELTINSIVDLAGATFAAGSTHTFDFILDEDEFLYELEIPRFSYRYRYEDGEYSSYAPFSQPAFNPDVYALDSEEGHNLGMTNHIKRIILSDFVPNHIPDDVKEVDILYKTSTSNNLYTIETFNRISNGFTSAGTGSHSGNYTIKEESLGAVLPSNQLIRPYDNVPRVARTQEIVANRLIFGNYLENYNVEDVLREPIDVNLDVDLSSYVNTAIGLDGSLSVKSGRSYQLGLVYRDRFGRETPVLTSEKCSIKSVKSLCEHANQLSAKVKNNVPYWADSYKFYIKETSTEFYNVAIDRVYPCDDNRDNVWLSFNSADINKFTKDDLLLLKKVHGASEPYTNARGDYDPEPYKILAIETEVPDSIITKHYPYQRPGHNVLMNGLSTAGGGWVAYETFAVQANGGGGQGVVRIRISSAYDYDKQYDQNTTSPVGIQSHPATGRVGGAWEALNCMPMYEDWVANQVELEVRLTAVGTQNNVNLTNPTPFMKVTAIADETYAKGGFPWQRPWPAPSYLVTAENFKDANNNFTNWGVNTGVATNQLANSGLRIEFRKVERKVEEEHLGKFFVKVKQKALGFFRFDTTDNGPLATADSGVFEVLPKRNPDVDLYYEASKAYPVKLNGINDEQFINVGDEVTAFTTNTATGATSPLALSGTPVVNSISADNPYNSGVVVLSVAQNINLATAGEVTMVFTNPSDKSFVTARLKESTHSALAQINATFAPASNPTGAGFPVTTAATQGSSTTIVIDAVTHNTSIASNINTKVGLPWFNCFSFRNGVESDRVRDDFNAPTISNGVRASTVFENYQEERKKSSLIYSGIYNSISGLNDTNQFIQGEKITKDLNPDYGSVQKLHTLDNNIVALCEEKVLNVLANKDAIFNADNNPQLVATNRVLGNAQPYAGEYGIGDNPESFASYGFQSFFVDRKRGAVLRLSRNGITPISEVGMSNWFSENLGKRSISCYGSYDTDKNEYNLAIENIIRGIRGGGGFKEYYTVSYSNSSDGWVCFKSYLPEAGCSVGKEYYTVFKGEMFKHHVDNTFTIIGQTQNTTGNVTTSSTTIELDTSVDFIAPGYVISGDGIPVGTTVSAVNNSANQITASATVTIPFQSTITFSYPTNNFYGAQYTSTLTTIFNESPNSIKSFNTINYEGTQAKVLENVDDIEYYNNVGKTGWHVESINTDQQEGRVQQFLNKEGKWYNNIQGLKTEWTSKQGLVGAQGNLDPREFSVQGIGLSKAVSSTTTNDSGVTSSNLQRHLIIKGNVAIDSPAASTNAIDLIGSNGVIYTREAISSNAEATFHSTGDIGSSSTPAPVYLASNLVSVHPGWIDTSIGPNPPTNPSSVFPDSQWEMRTAVVPATNSVLYGSALCVIASDFSILDGTLPPTAGGLADPNDPDSQVFSLVTSNSMGGSMTFNHRNNLNAAGTWGTFPATAVPRSHVVIQAATAANGYLGIHRWSGGWLPSEVSYVEFSDTLYRTNHYDPANKVQITIYYNGTGDVGPFDASLGLTQWYFAFSSEGLYGGCRLAATPLNLLVNTAGTNGLTNSTVTITPSTGVSQIGSANVSTSNTLTTLEVPFTPTISTDIFTATFEANTGFHFAEFPKVDIQSNNSRNYTVEFLDIEETVTEIKRVETAEKVAVEEGKGRKTKDEEKRSEKVDVTVTDSDIVYVIKRVIKISYQGDTFDEEDKITFTHDVVAIP